MMDVQRRLMEKRAIRHIEAPMSVPVFQSVTRIWHFPSGDALLERTGHRDCLIPDVDRVDVPVRGTEQVADAVALDTDTTVRIADRTGNLVVTKFDSNLNIG
ncbi:hypothetical protein BVU17_15715 [Haloarcula taiwanensis]|uniref:Uncharacterized protein n=1 Tax=Haloarcula taiwanensis TaxID=1932004 RepID=A0A2H5A2R6_9EURY|nr:hypothetical protein BVU17_15715 [Haloarcula taiwanensis]RLM34834.1 hypothetical protein DVK01_14280 [Haloarcula sp. Atlit-120R]